MLPNLRLALAVAAAQLAICTTIPVAAPPVQQDNHALSSSESSPESTATGGDCLTRSLALTSLAISSASITRGNPLSLANSSISFELYNGALDRSARCAAFGPALTPNGVGADPYLWYDCSMIDPAPGEPQGGGPGDVTARFRYDAVINHLTVNETWGCVDGVGGL